MKSFNARKLPKEHRLFLLNHGKISLTSKTGEKQIMKIIHYNINDRDSSKFEITGTWFAFKSCYKELSNIVPLYTISQKVKDFENRFNVKIKEVGLIRKDFAREINLDKISKIIKKIKEDQCGKNNNN